MKIILLIFFVALTFVINAQTEMQTADGKTIILNNDGTWHEKDKNAGVHSTMPSDCDFYSTGTVELVNKTNKRIKGIFTYIEGGKGKGGWTKYEPFTLAANSSHFYTDVREGNVKYDADSEVPSPIEPNSTMWGDPHLTGNEMVVRCKQTRVEIR